MQINILFETSSSGDYVGVLKNSELVNGQIASQDAGSSNIGIYYQVGGGGVNGLFADALNGAKHVNAGPLCISVNAALHDAYDNQFGRRLESRQQFGARGSINIVLHSATCKCSHYKPYGGRSDSRHRLFGWAASPWSKGI